MPPRHAVSNTTAYPASKLIKAAKSDEFRLLAVIAFMRCIAIELGVHFIPPNRNHYASDYHEKANGQLLLENGLLLDKLLFL
jgi:hypothetical protein